MKKTPPPSYLLCTYTRRDQDQKHRHQHDHTKSASDTTTTLTYERTMGGNGVFFGLLPVKTIEKRKTWSPTHARSDRKAVHVHSASSLKRPHLYCCRACSRDCYGADYWDGKPREYWVTAEPILLLRSMAAAFQRWTHNHHDTTPYSSLEFRSDSPRWTEDGVKSEMWETSKGESKKSPRPNRKRPFRSASLTAKRKIFPCPSTRRRQKRLTRRAMLTCRF